MDEFPLLFVTWSVSKPHASATVQRRRWKTLNHTTTACRLGSGLDEFLRKCLAGFRWIGTCDPIRYTKTLIQEIDLDLILRWLCQPMAALVRTVKQNRRSVRYSSETHRRSSGSSMGVEWSKEPFSDLLDDEVVQCQHGTSYTMTLTLLQGQNLKAGLICRESMFEWPSLSSQPRDQDVVGRRDGTFRWPQFALLGLF